MLQVATFKVFTSHVAFSQLLKFLLAKKLNWTFTPRGGNESNNIIGE